MLLIALWGDAFAYALGDESLIPFPLFLDILWFFSNCFPLSISIDCALGACWGLFFPYVVKCAAILFLFLPYL